jgi:hypothetical protein
MNSTMKLQIWLKDGSIFKDWTLTQSDIKVGGLAFDINRFEKFDDAYLYGTDGSKINRDRVSGTIDLHGPGITGSVKLSLDQIQDMARSAPGAAG